MELEAKIQKLVRDANELIDMIRSSNRGVTDIELHLLETEIHILQLEMTRLKLDRAIRRSRND